MMPIWLDSYRIFISKNHNFMDELKEIKEKFYKNNTDLKKIEYPIQINFDQAKGCYEAYYLDLDIEVSAKTIDELFEKAHIEKNNYIDKLLKNNKQIPMPESYRKHSGSFRIRVPKVLHKSLMEHATKNNMSFNKYCIELLKKG